MASKEHNFNLNTRGSRLTYLTSGEARGLDNNGAPTIVGAVAPISFAANNNQILQASAFVGQSHTVTGIVIPIGRGNAGGEPFSDATTPNQIGDPGEKTYSLTHGDLFDSNGKEKDGGAQKFINAVLDGAYVAYNSGVSQGSGLSSMTVTRGDLSLTNSTVTGFSGAVNTYSRSYSVTFNYTQSGNITSAGVASLPDITNDLVGEAGDGPF